MVQQEDKPEEEQVENYIVKLHIDVEAGLY